MSLINHLSEIIYDVHMHYYDVSSYKQYITVQNHTKNNKAYVYFGKRIANLLNVKNEVILEQLCQYINANNLDIKVKVEKDSLIIFCSKDLLNKYLVTLYNHKFVKEGSVLVDFSSPNVAKEMHVGHLRSTIIGDSICRLYEFLGVTTKRVNHIGDFGLNFGIIVNHIIEKHLDNYNSLTIQDLQNLYASGKKLFDTDNVFKANSYSVTQKIQFKTDPVINDIYQFIKEISKLAYTDIYNKLNINIEEVGESFYQPLIPSLVEDLKPILELDNGRQIIKNSDTDKCPLTIVKSDSSYTYDTTDLAAIKYRLDLDIDTIIYVVDIGQKDHFSRIFDVVNRMDWNKKGVVIKHIPFGIVKFMGKKIKTRDGDTIKLADLLDMAVSEVEKVMVDKKFLNKEDMVKTIAYNSIKYADLSISRVSDYSFQFSTMLDLTGNTAPYLMYNYVRTCSILKKSGVFLNEIDSIAIQDEEIEISKQLLYFPDVIEKLVSDLLFHNLCEYLYKLSSMFSRYLKQVRILNLVTGSVDMDKLYLCCIYKRIVEYCFNILGLVVLEEM